MREKLVKLPAISMLQTSRKLMTILIQTNDLAAEFLIIVSSPEHHHHVEQLNELSLTGDRVNFKKQNFQLKVLEIFLTLFLSVLPLLCIGLRQD